MSGSSETYHEPIDRLGSETLDQHRALVSLQEELEAVDWYRQRADACGDEALRGILLHNMREEIEHACMLLEWLRRRSPDFREHLATYLFAEGPIPIDDEEEPAAHAPGASGSGAEQVPGTLRLTIGSLRKR